MKSRIFVSLVFIMAFLMTGCVEKTGYYTKAEDDVILRGSIQNVA